MGCDDCNVLAKFVLTWWENLSIADRMAIAPEISKLNEPPSFVKYAQRLFAESWVFALLNIEDKIYIGVCKITGNASEMSIMKLAGLFNFIDFEKRFDIKPGFKYKAAPLQGMGYPHGSDPVEVLEGLWKEAENLRKMWKAIGVIGLQRVEEAKESGLDEKRKEETLEEAQRNLEKRYEGLTPRRKENP